EDARAVVAGLGPEDGSAAIASHVGTSVACQESVPAAFAVVDLAGGDPWRAAVIAANLGGDTDTIGAIAAGMAGASRGSSVLPQDRIAELRGFDISSVQALAAALVSRRFGDIREREPAT
ncbi:MAG TPA: ADP-ribosylglycohydrolase family protein, partial [Methylomirabilota bacterium]|nr:ADP-ribosylglycohydrolase family protein [Methylomirabilota bacterium]